MPTEASWHVPFVPMRSRLLAAAAPSSKGAASQPIAACDLPASPRPSRAGWLPTATSTPALASCTVPSSAACRGRHVEHLRGGRHDERDSSATASSQSPRWLVHTMPRRRRRRPHHALHRAAVVLAAERGALLVRHDHDGRGPYMRRRRGPAPREQPLTAGRCRARSSTTTNVHSCQVARRGRPLPARDDGLRVLRRYGRDAAGRHGRMFYDGGANFSLHALLLPFEGGRAGRIPPRRPPDQHVRLSTCSPSSPATASRQPRRRRHPPPTWRPTASAAPLARRRVVNIGLDAFHVPSRSDRDCGH